MTSSQALPIDTVLDEISAELRGSAAVVIEAPPGAGKTTRVPVALLNQGLAGDRLIVVLQPRRVAARSAARRVAAENGWRLGAEVGYQVRFDRRWGAQTRVLFVTEGIFLNMLQSDPFLEQVALIVFDEFHERSLDGDLSLAMARKVQLEVRTDLRLVVMSATLDGGPISNYLGSCPIVSVEVRPYPVEIGYLKRPVEGDPARTAAEGVARILDRTEGDVLVFLPGVAWIRRCVRLLATLATQKRLVVVELHGSLNPELQDRALQPTDRTKIVIATNIAETSLTIDGVSAVVDSGLARVMRFDRGNAINRLETSRISRASATQRAGRAGRQGPGVCLRLWTEAEDSGLREAETPEIQRLDLSGVVLQLLAWGESNIEVFPWFEAPPPRALEEALELLEIVGAVDENGLTRRGRVMAALPLHPRLACLLVEGWKRGVPDVAAWAGAVLSEGYRPEEGTSDLFETLPKDRPDRSSSLPRRVLDVRADLVNLCERRLGPARSAARPTREAFGRAVLAAFPDRLVRRRSGDRGRAVMVGNRGVRVDDRGHLVGHELLIAVGVLAGDRNREVEARVSHAVPVEREWLPEEHLSTTINIEFDQDTGHVRAWERVRWHDLLLNESLCKATDGNEVARVLARAAAAAPEKVLGLDRAPVATFLARLRSLAQWRPELELPTFTAQEIEALLPTLCQGKRSLSELGKLPMTSILTGLLSAKQRTALEREAPERLTVPSGSRIRLAYEPGRPPVLAVRVQELFGLGKTPTVAGGSVPVTLHLLAPNGRPQQITTDLASFWANTYPQVRSELRGRYPKHHWPEDPIAAQATSKTRRKKKSTI